MPCPSQMEEDEEGNQVNSARQTGCLLQHYWNYFPLLPMEIKKMDVTSLQVDGSPRGLFNLLLSAT